MSGAVDLDDCPSHYSGSGKCRCEPRCKICGEQKHMAIHGPLMGEPPGSKPWGHEYEPLTIEAETK